MKNLIEIDKYPVKDVLSLLLKDKTTGNNIIFATDTYSKYGYSECNYMTEMAVQGFASCDIQPRVLKAKSDQLERTRKKAEVFTPTWLCNMMNNSCDRDWFERKTVFNIEKEQKWSTVSKNISFPEGKDWKSYVDSRRLEITCGEAPYLVSRYDTTIGNVIPIKRRIGILDRKLRIVSENTNTEEEWLKWAVRAFQSVYGYEFQGDNLLIARINLIVTFCDYLYDKWQRTATKLELKKIANIISWNLWQMDGEKNTPPDIKIKDDFIQMAFFEVEEDEDDNLLCKVQNWRKECPFIFKELKNRKKGKNMKFDYIIGNPPYQENDGGGNGASATSVYPFFVQQAKALNPKCIVMITPSRWFSGGKGLDEFRDEMLNDNRIRVLHDYPTATDCFNDVQIKGGVSFFLWDSEKHGDCKVYSHRGNADVSTVTRPLLEKGCETFIRYNEAIDILRKVQKYDEKSMEELVSVRMPFGFPNTYKGNSKKKNSDDVIIYVSGNDRAVKGTTAFVPRKEVLKGETLIDCHKVYISKAGSGSDVFPHLILTKPFYGEPNSICNESYLVIGPFETKEICENVIAYIKTRFFRFMVLLKKNSQNAPRGVYQFVPQQDFSKKWTDKELYDKYNITDKEIVFINSMIKEMT